MLVLISYNTFVLTYSFHSYFSSFPSYENVILIFGMEVSWINPWGPMHLSLSLLCVQIIIILDTILTERTKLLIPPFQNLHDFPSHLVPWSLTQNMTELITYTIGDNPSPRVEFQCIWVWVLCCVMLIEEDIQAQKISLKQNQTHLSKNLLSNVKKLYQLS